MGNGKGVGTGGHAGFGIGTGYASQEDIVINNSRYNGQYGFFFEHQGKWRSSGVDYPATIIGNTSSTFVVRNSYAGLNEYDFGGERAYNLYYSNNESNESSEYKSYVSTGALKRTHATSPVLMGDLSTNTYIDDLDVVRSGYGDVASGANKVNWAIGKGIVIPKSGNEFGGNEIVKRGDALSMIWHYFNRTNSTLNDGMSYVHYNDPTIYYREPIYDFGGANYKKVGRVNHTDSTDVYAAMDWALDTGVTNGAGHEGNALEMNLSDDCRKIDYIVYLYRLSQENARNVVPLEFGSLDEYLSMFFDNVDNIRVARGDIGIEAVSWGVYRGLVDGLSGFSVEENIKKIDAITMLYDYDHDANIVVKP